jgi:hypothetical protein
MLYSRQTMVQGRLILLVSIDLHVGVKAISLKDATT